MDPLPVKKSNLLILRGVYPKDFVKRKPTVTLTQPVQVYSKMPAIFTSTKDWPQFSNLKCWSCDQLPVSYPKFIPLNPSYGPNYGHICDVFGHFCEWNCAVRYAVREFPREQHWDILESICLFESKFSGKKKEKIMEAPSKTCMKQYCGDDGITAQEYREKIMALNEDYSH